MYFKDLLALPTRAQTLRYRAGEKQRLLDDDSLDINMNLKRYKKLPLSARQAGISGETSLSTHVAGLGGASQRHGCSGVRPCLVSRKGTRDREEDPLGGWVGQSGRERDGAVKGRGRWAGSEGWGAGAHFPHPEAVRESCFLLSRDDPLVPISLRIAIPSRMSEA